VWKEFLYIKNVWKVFFVYKQCVIRNSCVWAMSVYKEFFLYKQRVYIEKGKRNLWKGIEVLYRPCRYKEKEFFNACVYREKSFFSCIGM